MSKGYHAFRTKYQAESKTKEGEVTEAETTYNQDERLQGKESYSYVSVSRGWLQPAH